LPPRALKFAISLLTRLAALTVTGRSAYVARFFISVTIAANGLG
jgi:hypothetical protein